MRNQNIKNMLLAADQNGLTLVGTLLPLWPVDREDFRPRPVDGVGVGDWSWLWAWLTLGGVTGGGVFGRSHSWPIFWRWLPFLPFQLGHHCVQSITKNRQRRLDNVVNETCQEISKSHWKVLCEKDKLLHPSEHMTMSLRAKWNWLQFFTSISDFCQLS